jgi:hypothetical protein
MQGITLATATVAVARNHKLVSVKLVDGKFEVVRQYHSSMVYGNGKPYPDTIEKEIYHVVHGEICLEKVVVGQHTPAYQVPEQITFE